MWRLVWMNAGLLIWSAHFGAVYLIGSVACGRGLAGTTVLGLAAVPAAILGATALALAATVPFIVRPIRALRGGEATAAVDRFLDWSTVAIAAYSALAIVFTALPSLIVPMCP